jgi:hypothetical protein
MTTNPRLRVEQGHAEGTSLRRLTMVCFVVLVFSGLVVHWTGGTTPPQHTADHPPAAEQPSPPDGKSRDQHQQTRLPGGGVDCDERA